jgi:hypothetical protein
VTYPGESWSIRRLSSLNIRSRRSSSGSRDLLFLVSEVVESSFSLYSCQIHRSDPPYFVKVSEIPKVIILSKSCLG